LFLDKDNYWYIAWHVAALGGSLEALETLWKWVRELERNTDELLLTETGNGYIAFQLAAWENHVEMLKTLWVWAEETQLNPNELKKKLFVVKDQKRFIAWHRSAIEGTLSALETLWNWLVKWKHRLSVAISNWGWKYCLPIGNR